MKGEVAYLFAFDVANEIRMAEVQEILKSRPIPVEIRTDHAFPKDLPLYKPLAIEATPITFSADGKTIRPFIRIYEVGVVSITFRISFDVVKFAQLLPFHHPVPIGGEPLDAVSRRLCADVLKSIQGALVQGTSPSEPDAYTVFCLTETDSQQDVNSWLAAHRDAIAGLLTETDADILSDAQVNEALRIQCSYTKKDIVVIDWDAALVVDLTGYVEDVLYILEMANLQLEEYRTMDLRLDKHLNRAYDDLKVLSFGLLGRDAAILRTLRLLRVDVTKLNDDVTNITKFTGDWYLARVYLGACDRFHLRQWRSSVEDRLGHLDKLYTVLHADIVNRRVFWLELLMVIFFIVELLGLFVIRK